MGYWIGYDDKCFFIFYNCVFIVNCNEGGEEIVFLFFYNKKEKKLVG